MHWIVASLVSALFLGVYELCTKHAVRENAIVPVLFFSTLTGAIVWLVLADWRRRFIRARCRRHW